MSYCTVSWYASLLDVVQTNSTEYLPLNGSACHEQAGRNRINRVTSTDAGNSLTELMGFLSNIKLGHWKSKSLGLGLKILQNKRSQPRGLGQPTRIPPGLLTKEQMSNLGNIPLNRDCGKSRPCWQSNPTSSWKGKLNEWMNEFLFWDLFLSLCWTDWQNKIIIKFSTRG